MTAVVLSSTKILVQWEDVPLGDRNGEITHYEVMYSPLMDFGGQISTETVIVVNMTRVLVGLEEYVTYNISVRAINSAGGGPYSDIVQAVTLQEGKHGNMYTPSISCWHFCIHFSHVSNDFTLINRVSVLKGKISSVQQDHHLLLLMFLHLLPHHPLSKLYGMGCLPYIKMESSLSMR